MKIYIVLRFDGEFSWPMWYSLDKTKAESICNQLKSAQEKEENFNWKSDDYSICEQQLEESLYLTKYQVPHTGEIYTEPNEKPYPSNRYYKTVSAEQILP